MVLAAQPNHGPTEDLNIICHMVRYNPGRDMTSVVTHLVYDAFGRVTSESNPTVDSLFLFTARPFDPDTGLQNNLNRWYDSVVGRWLSEDPIGFAGGDGNLYRYVGNQVLSRLDPRGLQKIEFVEPFTRYPSPSGSFELEITYVAVPIHPRRSTLANTPLDTS